MNKSTSAKLLIFIAFVLVFGIFSIKENIYGQTNANTMPNTNTMSNINAAQIQGTQEAGGHPGEEGTITRDSVT
jgi:hypothetical protein